MSDNAMNRHEILEALCKILEKEAEITSFLEKRLCDDCSPDELDWAAMRQKVSKRLSGLVKMYEFSQRLPRDELGISSQAAASYLLKVQFTLAHVLMWVDMIRGESFSEVYMESFRSIVQKVHEQFIALQHMTGECVDDPKSMNEALQAVLKLEREIDEDNIIICRQITVATDGESDFNCYMMRKIVRELEHISDHLKAYAEIISEI
jgi:hypothetical protein